MVRANSFGFRRALSYALDSVVVVALLAVLPTGDLLGREFARRTELLVPALYFFGFAFLGGTPGKYMLGLRLRRDDGPRPALGDVLRRYGAFLLVVAASIALDPFSAKAKATGIGVIGAVFVLELLVRRTWQLPRDRFSGTSYWKVAPRTR